MSSFDPYQSPLAGTVETRRGGLAYMEMFNYIFNNPNWLSNVGMLALLFMGMFLPVINILAQLVMMGYIYEVVIGLHRRHPRGYPDFDFNRFADYLMRGLWVFLVNLVAMLVVIPVVMVLFFGLAMVMAGLASMMGEDAGAAVGAVVVLLMLAGYLLFLLGLIVLQMYLIPFMLRAGLANSFGGAFDFGWAKDFVAKTWVEMLLGMLFIGVLGSVLNTIGLVLLCVGILFTAPLVMFASAHWLMQLYEIYLSRGGRPAPINL